MKIYKKILTSFIIVTLFTSIFITTASASTLNTFKSDYDSDEYTVKQIYFQDTLTIPQDWYPLKAVSNYLPIEVDWDNKTREIVVYGAPLTQLNNFSISKDKAVKTTRRYKSDKLPSSLKIKNGVTYCSPQLLSSLLGGSGFIYNGEVYCFDGESKPSNLIKTGGSTCFKDNVITSMYQMKLKMPDEYKFVRKYLTGGISCVEKNSNATIPSNTLGYVYPNVSKPCCYVVGDKLTGTSLASLIAHESYHVYQYKSGRNVDEDGADKYEKMIKATMISMN